MKPNRNTRNALVRMRAAYLDLQSGQRYTEANELLEIIERIEPPAPREAGVAVGSAARSESASLPPVTSAPATYEGRIGWTLDCANCGEKMSSHCTMHLLPCCPGSLMHGQDEGTWTPTTAHR